MRYIFVVVLLTASAAQAESWLKIADLDTKGSALLLETAGVDRGNPLRKASFKLVYTADRPIKDGYQDVPPDVRSYRWEASQGSFNCTEQTVAVSQSVLHGEGDEVVGHIDIDENHLKFGKVPPGSFGGLMLAQVCAPATPDGQPMPAPAKLTYVVNPDDYYPSRFKKEGSPVVKVCVGPDGTILREPEITDTSSFPELDGAAVKVAKANRYSAAIVNGTAAPESCIKFKVKFLRRNF